MAGAGDEVEGFGVRRGVKDGAAVLLLLPGCQALTGQTMGQHLDDSVITTEVKAKLGTEKAMYTTRVSVKTEGGVVHLTGNVPSQEDKDQVIKIAKDVKGVKEVVERLEIKP